MIGCHAVRSCGESTVRQPKQAYISDGPSQGPSHHLLGEWRMSAGFDVLGWVWRRAPDQYPSKMLHLKIPSFRKTAAKNHAAENESEYDSCRNPIECVNGIVKGPQRNLASNSGKLNSKFSWSIVEQLRQTDVWSAATKPPSMPRDGETQ